MLLRCSFVDHSHGLQLLFKFVESCLERREEMVHKACQHLDPLLSTRRLKLLLQSFEVFD